MVGLGAKEQLISIWELCGTHFGGNVELICIIISPLCLVSKVLCLGCNNSSSNNPISTGINALQANQHWDK